MGLGKYILLYNYEGRPCGAGNRDSIHFTVAAVPMLATERWWCSHLHSLVFLDIYIVLNLCLNSALNGVFPHLNSPLLETLHSRVSHPKRQNDRSCYLLCCWTEYWIRYWWRGRNRELPWTGCQMQCGYQNCAKWQSLQDSIHNDATKHVANILFQRQECFS